MQTGFFKKETQATAARTPKKRATAAKPTACPCGLDKHCRTPKMDVTGEGRLRILVIGEAPGAQEDGIREIEGVEVRGWQFVGKAGQTLRKTLSSFGVDLDRDCWKTNAVQCRPFERGADGKEHNREPEGFEIDCCRPRVWRQIDALKPKLILLLGGAAIESFLGHRWPGRLGGVNKWRGWQVPDREARAWVCPTFHPSYVMRSAKEPVVELIWRQDLERALALVDEPLPVVRDERHCVEAVGGGKGFTVAQAIDQMSTADQDYVVRRLEEMRYDHGGLFYLDFECNSRKPYLAGRRVLMCAVSCAQNHALSFPVTPRIAAVLADILADKSVKKGAQNMKFEDAWANVRVFADGRHVDGWYWDSMLGANILDNRKGVSGLKFQLYVNYGLLAYNEAVSGYMDADGDGYEGDAGDAAKDANAINKLEQAPADDVLLYGGVDALGGRRLSFRQMAAINADADLRRAYDQFHEGTYTMAEMEQAGMRVDIDYVRDTYRHLVERRIPALQQAVEQDELVVAWKKRYGAKFNMSSDDQLGTMLVEHLSLQLPETPASTAAKRRYSTAASVLEDIEDDAPFVKHVQDIERLKKVASTNLKGLIREAPDGWLHPFFNLGGDADGEHVVTSYRSSSSAPNFQNIPIRHPESKRLIRQAFIPRPGMQRLSIDFKGIEVAVSCCVHHDPKMIQYVTDKSTNMHRDMAQQLYMLGDDEWTKEARQAAKNHFVFPEFYGDWWRSTAESLWKAVRREFVKTQAGVSLYDHLASKGVEQYRCENCKRAERNRKAARRRDYACCFENHVRLVEEDFWGTRFREYTRWKERHMREYERRGYFYLLTGFRVGGVLRKNQALNLPVQGPAFHCNLFTLNRVRDIRKRECWQSPLVGQIHDSGEADVVPAETAHIVNTFNRVVAEDLREAMPWTATVPFELEYEITPVGGSWYEKQELKL